MIDRYIDKGIMYALDDNGVQTICVVTDEGNDSMVVKKERKVKDYNERCKIRVSLQKTAMRKAWSLHRLQRTSSK